MFSSNSLENLGLPKWPAMAVIGNDVTKDQAKEILIRTGLFYWSTNDQDFETQLEKAVGLESSKIEKNFDWNAYYEKKEIIRESYKVLSLGYLRNSRIASCYVGGPHGWCDWNGKIGCNSYNIGKWPSVEGVFDEWKMIAEAFPFLNLRCQLFNGEQCEEGIKPVVEFFVSNGKTELYEPKEIFEIKHDDDILLHAKAFFSQRDMNIAERGCSIEQFKEALKYVGDKYYNPKGRGSALEV